MTVEIRDYQPSDFARCRELWAELTKWHRRIYEDPTIGGDDPGKAFETYIERPELHRAWVAVVGAEVVGLTGLIVRGEEGDLEPLIVAPQHRRKGIGTRLVERVVAEAGRLGLRFLSARPVARNVEALRFFVDTGFDILGHVDLFQDLRSPSPRRWRDGMAIHGRKLRY